MTLELHLPPDASDNSKGAEHLPGADRPWRDGPPSRHDQAVIDKMSATLGNLLSELDDLTSTERSVIGTRVSHAGQSPPETAAQSASQSCAVRMPTGSLHKKRSQVTSGHVTPPISSSI